MTTPHTEAEISASTPTPQVDEIAKALAAFQSATTNPIMDCTAKVSSKSGASYQYKYASLATILSHVRPNLTANGLAVVQIVQPGMLITRLIHTSGQMFEARYALPTTGSAQDLGSAITYGRRYTLVPLLGIAAESDDDGSAASGIPAHTARDPKAELVELMSNAMIGNKALGDYCRSAGLGDFRALADIPDQIATQLVETWPKVIAAIKVAAMPRAGDDAPKQTATAPAAKAETPKLEVLPKSDAPPAIDPRLVAAMNEAGITGEQLYSYYVAAKHHAPTVPLAGLPTVYIDQLLKPSNWTKVLQKIKAN